MKRLCAVLLSLGLLAGNGSAADVKKGDAPKRNPAQAFERLDKNKDGFVDKAEAPEKMKKLFDRLDKNKDGKLAKSEMQPGKKKNKKDK